MFRLVEVGRPEVSRDDAPVEDPEPFLRDPRADTLEIMEGLREFSGEAHGAGQRRAGTERAGPPGYAGRVSEAARIVVEAREAPAERCPYCHDGLGAAETFTCPACATRLHPDCRRDAGRCTTAGCTGPPPGQAAEAARERAAEAARGRAPAAAGVAGRPGVTRPALAPAASSPWRDAAVEVARQVVSLVLGVAVGVVVLGAGVLGGLAVMWRGGWVAGLALVTAGISGGLWGGAAVRAVVLGEPVPRFREVVR